MYIIISWASGIFVAVSLCLVKCHWVEFVFCQIGTVSCVLDGPCPNLHFICRQHSHQFSHQAIEVLCSWASFLQLSIHHRPYISSHDHHVDYRLHKLGPVGSSFDIGSCGLGVCWIWMDFDISYIFCRKAPRIFEFLELPLIFYCTFHSYSLNFSFFSICGMLFVYILSYSYLHGISTSFAFTKALFTCKLHGILKFFIKSFNLLANTNIEDVT